MLVRLPEDCDQTAVLPTGRYLHLEDTNARAGLMEGAFLLAPCPNLMRLHEGKGASPMLRPAGGTGAVGADEPYGQFVESAVDN